MSECRTTCTPFARIALYHDVDCSRSLNGMKDMQNLGQAKGLITIIESKQSIYEWMSYFAVGKQISANSGTMQSSALVLHLVCYHTDFETFKDVRARIRSMASMQVEHVETKA